MSIHSDSDATSVMDLDCWEQGPDPQDFQTRRESKLQRQLPFPRGVILPRTGLSSEAFTSLDQSRQQKISKHPSGRELDGLIMLVRSLLACGFHGDNKATFGDTRLYDVAAHRWGYRRFNDYAVKGHLLAILRDTAGGDETYEPTMYDLVRHPLVVQSIWAHPRMAFFAQSTSFKNPDTGAWEAVLPDFLSLAEQAKRIPFSPSAEVSLGTYFETKTGVIVHDGLHYLLASTFPIIIPVSMRGGRPFDEVRTFDLEGFAWDRPTPTTKKLNPKCFARYVVAMVVNLSNGDARHYDGSSRPIVEHLATAAGEDMRNKHVRAEGNAEWNFAAPASRGGDFLFLYHRSVEYGTGPAPHNNAVYNPVLSTGREYESPSV